MLQQSQIIPEIMKLCRAGKYDEAIQLTNKIERKDIAVKAHLLCMEHEQRSRITREALEQKAREVCSAEFYYELLDSIGAMSNDDLIEFIERNKV